MHGKKITQLYSSMPADSRAVNQVNFDVLEVIGEC